MKISLNKKNRIIEQILLFLYHSFPNEPFTAEIARDIARDEEYVKKILLELSDKGLVVSVKKNSDGTSFRRRAKWRLATKVYEVYKQRQ
jgi:DNA-binding IscR family transcriptional regulator